jgi:hypothetical protein
LLLKPTEFVKSIDDVDHQRGFFRGWQLTLPFGSWGEQVKNFLL